MKSINAKLLTILILLFTALTAACTSFGSGGVEPSAPLSPTETPEPTDIPPTETPAPTVDPLDQTIWDLVSIAGDAVDSHITIEFTDGQVGGSDGCNGYGASYTVSGDTISFNTEGFMSTMMACEPPIMEAADRYMTALQSASTFALDGDTLTIETAEGTLVYTVPQTAEVEGVRWVLSGTVVGGDAFVHSAIDSDIFIRLEDGQVSGFAGCNNLTGTYTLAGESLSFGPLATTRKMCDTERNEREAIVLEWLGKTTRASVERQILSLFDENDLLLMTWQAQTDTLGETTLFVGAEQVDCVGVGPQKCLLIKEDPAAEWTYFYDQIEGFEWEAGYEYELLVNISEVENPPADASSLRYELIEVVSKVAVEE